MGTAMRPDLFMNERPLKTAPMPQGGSDNGA